MIEIAQPPAIIMPAPFVAKAPHVWRPSLKDMVVMGLLPGMTGAVARKATPSIVSATRAYTDNAIDVTGAPTFNFGAKVFAFSTAAAGRQIAAIINAPRVAGTGGTISSVTIGGVAASLVVAVNNTAGGNTSRTEMWVASVPTGTSGTISVTVNSGGAARIITYAIYGASAVVPSGAAIGSSTASPGTASINIAAGGVAIAGIIDAVGTTAVAWTGTAGLAEDLDTVMSAGGVSSASMAFAAAQTGVSAIATYTAPTAPAFVMAAWPPA